MDFDIEIHTRNNGEKIVSVSIGGRIVVMTAFEWLQLCEQVVTEINRSAQVRPTLHAPDAAKTAAEKEK